MLYRISVTERGLTGIANIFRSRLSRLDDLLGAGTVPLNKLGKNVTRLYCAGSYVDFAEPEPSSHHATISQQTPSSFTAGNQVT